MTCKDCIESEKKFRIMQAQLTFEIKKLNEDKAHQKLTLEMGHQKEAKKLSEKLKHEQHEREVDNRKWMQKYDSMVGQYQKKLELCHLDFQQRFAEMEKELANRQERKIVEKQDKIKEEIAQVKAQTEEFKKKLLNVKEEEKKLQSKFHQEQIIKLTEKWNREKDLLEEEKQRLVDVIKDQEKDILAKHALQIELSQEIYYRKQEIDKLKMKINELQHTIKFCYEELANKDKQIQSVKRQSVQKLKKIQNDNKQEKDRIVSSMTKNMEDLMQKQYENCQKFEEKLREMEERRQVEIALYYKNIELVKSIAEQKRYLPKFTEQINNLKGKLSSKEKDFQKALRDIKDYQLQIENKEDIFHKFLNPNPHMNHTCTQTFTPTNRRKEYSIKKNRASLTRNGFKEAGKYSSTSTTGDILNHMTSLEQLDKFKDFAPISKLL